MKCPDCVNTNGLYVPFIGNAIPCPTCQGSMEIDHNDIDTEITPDEEEQCDESDYIVINGLRRKILNVRDHGHWADIETDDGCFYVFEEREEAEAMTRQYWEDFVEEDPDEFVEIVGKDALISWALGKWAQNASSLQEWLDMVSSEPEAHLASYDGEECEVYGYQTSDVSFDLRYAYRYN